MRGENSKWNGGLVKRTPKPVEVEPVAEKSKEKVDWAKKANYPQRKKSLMEYTKMSSVIFGSNLPEVQTHREREGSKEGSKESKKRHSVRSQAKMTLRTTKLAPPSQSKPT